MINEWDVAKIPVSGTSHSKQEYMAKIYGPLLKLFAGPTSCKVRRIVGDGDVVAVECMARLR